MSRRGTSLTWLYLIPVVLSGGESHFAPVISFSLRVQGWGVFVCP